jgi:hypothetical protein
VGAVGLASAAVVLAGVDDQGVVFVVELGFGGKVFLEEGANLVIGSFGMSPA